jgi:hypothetical protein
MLLRKNFTIYTPKSAASISVFFQDSFKMISPEFRPETGTEKQFGVGNLPEKKITYPLFSAGTDQDIRIWHICSI